MKKLFLIFALLILPTLFFPPIASAQFLSWDSSCLDHGVATLRCIPFIFKNVVAAFMIFVGVVALFMIIYSGIKLITSGGDPKQVQAARQIMTYAIIGAVLVLSSFAIIYFIDYLTGGKGTVTNIDCLKNNPPTC